MLNIHKWLLGCSQSLGSFFSFVFCAALLSVSLFSSGGMASSQASAEPIPSLAPTLVTELSTLSDIFSSGFFSRPEEDHSSAITVFLTHARVAMEQLAYTTPIKHNAFQLYQSVLLLDQENEEALAGIGRIQNAYIALLQRASEAREAEKIRSFYHRAKGVGVSDDVLSQYQNQFVPLNDLTEKQASGITLTAPRFNNEKYAAQLRLMGKAHQSQSQFLQAIPIYEKLVSLSEVEPNDWLALAVSLDAVGHFTDAKTAYEHVITHKHPSKKIMNFTRHRIHELSQRKDK